MDVIQRQRELAALLGDRLPPHWVSAYTSVPRHAFLPAQALAAPENGKPFEIDRDADPDGWLAAAYSDEAVVTRRDERGSYTSSCYAWVDQTKPGGILVVPLRTPLNNGGIVKLTVRPDGDASGPFLHTSAFMWLRAQAFMPPDEPVDFDEAAERSHVDIHASHVSSNDAIFVAGHLVPDCMMFTDDSDEGDIERFWFHGMDSWASADGTGLVRQMGKRRLWDEILSAHGAWEAWGKPSITQFGITVTPDHQSLWLEQPSQVVSFRATS